MWLNMMSVFLSFFIALGTGAFLIANRENGDSGASKTGLALSYSFLIPYFMTNTAWIYMTLKTNFTSLERMLEFNTIDQEPAHEIDFDDRLDAVSYTHLTLPTTPYV